MHALADMLKVQAHQGRHWMHVAEPRVVVNERLPLPNARHAYRLRRRNLAARLPNRRRGFQRSGGLIQSRVLSLLDASCPRTRENGHVFVWPAGSDPDACAACRLGGSRAVDEIPMQELLALARQASAERASGDTGNEHDK